MNIFHQVRQTSLSATAGIPHEAGPARNLSDSVRQIPQVFMAVGVADRKVCLKGPGEGRLADAAST